MDQATTIYYMLPIGGSIDKQRIRPYCSIQPPLFRYMCLFRESESALWQSFCRIIRQQEAVDLFCGAWVTLPNPFESVFSSQLNLAKRKKKKKNHQRASREYAKV